MDHARRRSRIGFPLEELGLDALLVTRLTNIRYFTGFTGTNAQLIVTPHDAAFFTDSRYQEQASHEVPDLDRHIYPKRFVEALAEEISGRKIRRLGFESSGVTHKTWTELAGIDGVELIPTEELIERLRWVKDQDELELIERAQAATDEAFDRVTRKLAEGVTEREVSFELEAAMRDAGADALGFPTIVAFGESAAEPHHGPGDRPLAKGDVVELDFGARVGGYHSDMTRTVAFGEPDPRIREIHQVVLQAQEAGCAAVRAGTPGADPDRAAREVIENAGYGERFGHSLGHGIGLEVHEGPSLRPGCGDVLPAGTIVTVEPGIYIPGLGGVRIEDMVLVTEDGCRALPRTTKELLTL